MYRIIIKRIYDDYDVTDGYRVLVDRIWPRGFTKEMAKLDEWNRDITPSPALRKAIHNDDISWENFYIIYKDELEENSDFLKWKKKMLKELEKNNITLITSAKLNPLSHPYAIKEMLLLK